MISTVSLSYDSYLHPFSVSYLYEHESSALLHDLLALIGDGVLVGSRCAAFRPCHVRNMLLS